VTGFAIRAPWYARERAAEKDPKVGLRSPAMFRPAIQMYDDTDFVDRLVRDPRDSLKFGEDDLWSYPVPMTPSGSGRNRLATFELITTNLRKLYQPVHNRFYAVVVEVFCDQAGLPRAGNHDDIEVGFVLRRQVTTLSGGSKPSRRLARNLLVEMVKEKRKREGRDKEDVADETGRSPDVRDVWFADQAWNQRIAAENRDLIDQLKAETTRQGWVAPAGESPHWVTTPEGELVDHEETFPMWRLPARDEDCGKAQTRSLWFGLVPTYSSEHEITSDGRALPKYDDHAIYEIDSFVRQQPGPGHEHCPPKIWMNVLPSEPFRFASPTDPQGTSKRITTITLPDMRRLSARAGQPMGPGGVQIVTPPGSGFSFNPFNGGKLPESGSGAVGGNGQVCMFALELFFIVAFFLFLMFLPIVVFLFQLWWLLALRFCIPPSIGFGIAADFFAQSNAKLSGFETDQGVLDALAQKDKDLSPGEAFDQMFGTDSTQLKEKGTWLKQMQDAKDAQGTPVFANDRKLVRAAVVSARPPKKVEPEPPELETKPDDPLCG
jgi:hypothetical protein